MQRYILTFLVSLILLGCSQSDEVKQQRETRVKLGKLNNALYFSGQLQPLGLVNVASPVDGVVVKKDFHYGQTVQSGQALIEVASDDLQKQYSNALTEYLTAKDKLSKTKSNFKSSEELWKLGIISDNDFDNSKSEYNNSNMNFLRARYSLESVLKQGNGALKDVEYLDIANIHDVDAALSKRYDKVTLRAKTSGLALSPVTGKETGSEKIAVGSEVKRGQVLVSVGDLSGFTIKITVNEIDLDKVKVGQDVLITGVAFSEMKIRGKISALDSQASTSSRGMNSLPSFQASVTVKDLTPQQKKMLHVGMSATIKLLVDNKSRLLIPIDAVHMRNGKNWVKRKTARGIADVQIDPGLTDANQVEVKHGLKAGDVVIYG